MSWVILGVVGFIVMFVWSLCKISSDTDDRFGADDVINWYKEHKDD